MKKRPVRCRDLNTGEIIAEYESISAVGKALKKRDSANICNVLKGKAYSAYGYFWEYIEEKENPKLPKRPFTRQQAIEYMRKHPQQSFNQFAENTGVKVNELRKIYDEEKLYRF